MPTIAEMSSQNLSVDSPPTFKTSSWLSSIDSSSSTFEMLVIREKPKYQFSSFNYEFLTRILAHPYPIFWGGGVWSRVEGLSLKPEISKKSKRGVRQDFFLPITFIWHWIDKIKYVLNSRRISYVYLTIIFLNE